MAEEKKEAFLSRWSRRKGEDAKPVEAPLDRRPDEPVPALPPTEHLTPASDFTGFMHPGVEDALRRVALRKLFSDPHFNLPDLFEPYSGDWTVSEPIPEAMLASLEQMKTMLRRPPSEAPKEDLSEKQRSAAEAPGNDEPGQQDA